MFSTLELTRLNEMHFFFLDCFFFSKGKFNKTVRSDRKGRCAPVQTDLAISQVEVELVTGLTTAAVLSVAVVI